MSERTNLSAGRTQARAAQGAAAWVILCAVAIFSHAALESMLAPAIPIIRAALHLTPAASAWIFTGVFLTGAVATPLVSRAADIFDRREILIFILGAVCLGIGIAATATGVLTLVLGSLLQGFGLSLVPLSVALVKEHSADARSGNALIIAAGSASSIIGLSFAGVLLKLLTFRGLYLFSLAPLSACLLVAIAWRLRSPTIRPGGVRLDIFGAAVLGASLLALLIGLTVAPEIGWTSAKSLALLAFSLAGGAVFVRHALRVQEPLVDLRLFHDPLIKRAGLVAGITGYGITATFIAAPLLVEAATGVGGLGRSVGDASLALITFSIGAVLAPLCVRGIADRIGAGGAMLCGSVLVVAAPLILLSGPGLGLVCAALGAVGAGAGLIMTQAMNSIGVVVSNARLASASGAFYVIKSIGGALGGQISASFFGRGFSHDGLVWAMAITAVLGAVSGFAALDLARRPNENLQ